MVLFVYKTGRRASEENNRSLHWEDCQEQIDMVALAAKEPIFFLLLGL